MERTDHNRVVAEIQRRKLSAIIRANDQQLAADAMRAAVQGGFRIIEFTLTTPGALELIREFARDPYLLVGAGTVLAPEEVRQAVDSGAHFIVSPVCDPLVIAEAARLSIVSIPGAFTPTEMLSAHRAGADFVKLFPAPANVADYVSAILAPLPFLRIFPTAGVTQENLVDVLHAGAVGAGFVKALFHPPDMADRNFAAIERRAQAILLRLKDL